MTSVPFLWGGGVSWPPLPSLTRPYPASGSHVGLPTFTAHKYVTNAAQPVNTLQLITWHQQRCVAISAAFDDTVSSRTFRQGISDTFQRIYGCLSPTESQKTGLQTFQSARICVQQF